MGRDLAGGQSADAELSGVPEPLSVAAPEETGEAGADKGVVATWLRRFDLTRRHVVAVVVLYVMFKRYDWI